MLAEESDQGTICTPNDVLDRRRGDLCQRLLLLYVVQDNRGCRAEDETSSATVEDFVCHHGRLDGLNDGVGHVAYFDQL